MPRGGEIDDAQTAKRKTARPGRFDAFIIRAAMHDLSRHSTEQFGLRRLAVEVQHTNETTHRGATSGGRLVRSRWSLGRKTRYP